MKTGRLRLFFFFLFVTYGAFLPFFPTWLEARGVRGVAMSALMALGPALGVIGPPAFGALADWLGLRAGLLRLATAGGFAATLALVLSALAGRAAGLPLLFAAMFLFSMSRTPAVAMADVIALETAKAQTAAGKPQSYGAFRLWGSIGFLIAAVVVGRALDVRDALALPLFLAASCLATLGLAFTLAAPPHAPAPRLAASLRGVLRDPGFALLLLSAFFGFGAHVSYDICFSLHLQRLGLGSAGIGVAWALGVLAEVGLMAISGRLLARVAASRLLVLAHASGALRWLLIALITDYRLLLALQPLHALSFALFWVTSLEHVKRRAPGEILATAQGLFNAALGAGAVIGMFVWGALFEAYGGGLTFACAAGVAALAAIAASGADRGAPRASSPELV